MTWRNAIGAAVVCAAAAVEAATPSVALPPFIITGRVIDYLGAGLSSAEVRVRKDGVLLARGSVGDIGADSSANYAVTVPMASTQIATAASQGDTLVLEIDSGAGSFSSTNAVVEAANPGRTLKLDLRAASCTNLPQGGRLSRGTSSTRRSAAGKTGCFCRESSLRRQLH